MKKRIVTIFMTALMLFSTIGCGGGKKKALFPVYDDSKQMAIAGWDSPIDTLADYQLAKDMGLTYMFIDEMFAQRGTEKYKQILDYCAQVGLKGIINFGSNQTTFVDKPDDTVYSDYPGVGAINYWDEPWYSSFDKLSELADQHMRTYGGKLEFFVNLYPNSAIPTFEGHSYDEYVQAFCDKVLAKITEGTRILSCDIYPLEKQSDGTGSVLLSNWLSCIETIATYAKQYGAEGHVFLQSTEHLNYRAITADDLRWQFYVNMAFGIKRFTYFTYTTSFLQNFQKSCVDRNISCKTYPQYDNAKEVNTEIESFDNVYLNFNWNGVMPLLGINNEAGYDMNFDGLNHALDSLDCVNRAQSDQDALIGQFKDKDGNDGLMVVNFTDPYYQTSNNVKIEFIKATRALVYRKGAAKAYTVQKNRMEIPLDPGEGVFIIPIA